MAKSSTLVSSSTNGGKQAQVAGRRGKAKPNGSILNFFQKVEPSKGTIGSGVLLITNDKESLFVKESTAPADVLTRCRSETPDLPDSGFGLAGPEGDFPDDRYNSPTEGTRYNEDAQSDKRRRVGSPEDGYSVNNGDPAIAVPGGATQLDQDQHALPHIADLLWSDTKLETAGAGPIDRDCSPKPGQNQSVPVELKSSHLPLQPGHSPQSRTDAGLSSGLEHQPDLQLRLGPFVEDNDSDDDKKSAGISSSFNWKETAGNEQDPLGQEFTDSASAPGEVEVLPGRHAAFSKAIPPSLTRESTSIYDVDEFAGVELDDEEYEEGEEYLERRLMEEQGRLELAESGFDESYDETDQESTIQHLTIDDGTNRAAHNSTTATCPLCDYDLGGLTDNVCLLHHMRKDHSDPTRMLKCTSITALMATKRHFQRLQINHIRLLLQILPLAEAVTISNPRSQDKPVPLTWAVKVGLHRRLFHGLCLLTPKMQRGLPQQPLNRPHAANLLFRGLARSIKSCLGFSSV